MAAASKTRKPAEIARDLRSARGALGVTRVELAARAKVRPADVNAAEGVGTVSLSIAASMAEALGGTLEDLLAGRVFWEAPAFALKLNHARAEVAVLRGALARVNAAARMERMLAAALDLPDVWQKREASLRVQPLANDEVGHETRGAEHQQAEDLAGKVRALLGNVEGPIASMRATLAHFGVASFLTDLAAPEIDGLVLFEPGRPPFVVVNVAAKRRLVTALRMTLAHELCHALFDRPRSGAFAIIEMESERGQAIERRANAFAAHLLAPRAAVIHALEERGWKNGDVIERQHVAALSRYFLIGVEALAGHLVSCGVWQRHEMTRFQDLQSERLASDDDDEVARPSAAEQLVPLERRGVVLDLACRAIEAGKISPGRFRAVLGLQGIREWSTLLVERGIPAPQEHHRDVAA